MKMPRRLPGLDYLRECYLLDLTSPTGLRWKERPRSHFKSDVRYRISCALIGKPAGVKASSLRRSSYVVSDNARLFTVARIVFALANSRDPWPFEVDHKDRNPLNNNPANLRLATRSQNARNMGLRGGNKSGCTGVGSNNRGRWLAQITVEGKTYRLGLFRDKEKAIAARRMAESIHHGEFAPLA